MPRTFIATVGVLGVALAAAVGPGVTLSRCLLTGKVTLACCCAAETPVAADQLGDAADGCCTVQTLAAPWQGSQLPHQSVVSPSLALGFPLLNVLPAASVSARLTPRRTDWPAPSGRGALVLRV